jgi:hypothetical protein
LERESGKQRARLHQIGFKIGLFSGRKTTVQHGFDLGYHLGALSSLSHSFGLGPSENILDPEHALKSNPTSPIDTIMIRTKDPNESVETLDKQYSPRTSTLAENNLAVQMVSELERYEKIKSLIIEAVDDAITSMT